MNYKVKSPIIFIIFNRPDVTRKVFSAIAKAKPDKLLLIADGARINYPDDEQNCKITREIVANVKWDCEVLHNYSDVNMGCKQRVSSGLNWAFELVENAIILEDDCLPHSSFFQFCDELLPKYRNDNRIAMISGDNFQFGRQNTENSYYFSKYSHIWGWASWRRSWLDFDPNLKKWPKLHKFSWLRKILTNKLSIFYWYHIFNSSYRSKIDSWAYPWLFSCWVQNKVTILPNVNLISNIGFGEHALHTKNKDKYSNMERTQMNFPLTHPVSINVDQIADNITEKEMFSGSALQRLIKKFIR